MFDAGGWGTMNGNLRGVDQVIVIRRLGVLLAVLVLACSCAHKRMVMEFHALVRYEKPEISVVSHEVQDTRRDGGTVVVSVEIQGDPGLIASFDIMPSVAEAQPMREIGDGSYQGEFQFPRDAVGGPFTVIGRLRHDEAGEIVQRDPIQFSISLLR